MDNVVLEKLKLANAKLKEFDSYKSEPIAIVGMGSRFPGNSADLDSYWDLLANGRSGIGRVPDDRWSVQEFEGDELYQPGKIVSDRGGFVPHLKDFDERVFEIAPIEAKYLDPQHRLLLEVSWETFENAQFDIGSINQTALGIYLGISNSDYAYTLFDSDYDELNPYFSTGNSHSTAAGRLSHFYGSKGPCVSLDTACSSSLVGIHYAVQALRTRECDVALAGGVNRILSPIVSICFSQAHMLSPDGECKTFDEAANGYVRGEGCGMVLLKRMSDAVKENRPILGIIRGSAINHDGRSSGLTVPNGPSQQQLVRDALKNAKLSPDDISYIEAHGTGTELGDPIELGALGAVFSDGRSEQEPLRVGSVKTNIGHLEPAAGIAGFIKTVLALQHKTIPPHLNFSRPNPHVDWSELGIKIPQQSEPWQPRNGRRIAGVSSFGFSGTNAHVIVEEAPERAEVVGRSKRNAHLLTLSAKSGEALEGLRKAYIDFLQNSPADAGSICHHAGAGRSDFAYRIAVTGEDKDALRQQLQKLTPADFSAPVMQANRIAVLFTGQGSQYLGMGKVLYDSNKYFRHQIDHCAELLTPTLSRPLTEILWGDAEALIDDTRYTQVALFALEYSLFRWWEYQGLKPHYVMGHSVGEYVAACVAGVFSLEDGLRLMEACGRLMAERAEAGGMLAVLADGKRVEELLAQQGDRKLSIAAYNGPRNTVVAGCPEALQRFGQTLEQQAIAQVPLVVSHGFHSPQMAPVLDAFREVAESVTYHRPQLGLVSNVSGAVDNECWTQADYWVTHIMAPVKYAQSVTALLSVGVSCFVEVGPHPVLTALGRQISREGCWLSTLQRGRDDWDSLTESLGTLYRQGHVLAWQHLDEGERVVAVDLPLYPFNRQPYWITEEVDALSVYGAVEPTEPETTKYLYQVKWQEVQLPPPVHVSDPCNWILVLPDHNTPPGFITNISETEEPDRLTRLDVDYSDSGSLIQACERLAAALENTCDCSSRLVLVVPDAVDRTDREYENWKAFLSLAGKAFSMLWSLRLNDLPVIFLGADEDIGREGTQALNSLLKGSMTGLVNVLNAEHPGNRHLSILAENLSTINLESLGSEIAAERSESAVRWIGGKRYVARLSSKDLAPDASASFQYSGDDSILITGGLGAIGFQIAKSLVQKNVREIVLTGRRPLDARLQERLESLQSGTAKVVYYSCDVADHSALAELIDRLKPRLTGIIHCAGSLSDRLMRDLTAEDIETTLNAKLLGAWSLYSLTRGLSLKSFVLFSSAAPLMGTPGQSLYSFANGFLDQLALAGCRESEAAVVSLGWPVWEGLGMAESAYAAERLSGLEALPATKGVRLFHQLLRSHRGAVGILPVEWETLQQDNPAADRLIRSYPYFDQICSTPADATQLDPHPLLSELETVPVNLRADRLLEELQKIVAQVMRVGDWRQVDVTTGFIELGVESLTAMEIIAAIERCLGLKIPNTALFDYPTLIGVRDLICGLSPYRDLIQPEMFASDPVLDSDIVPSPTTPTSASSIGQELQELDYWLNEG